MAATNPMAGFRDIYPWPYAWSRDIEPSVISKLTYLTALYDNLDYWTYENHWSLQHWSVKPPYGLITDIYWRDEGEYRQQLPPPIGDHVVSLLISHRGDDIALILWKYRKWTLRDGWVTHTGEQGDFVAHIHVEWLPDEQAEV